LSRVAVIVVIVLLAGGCGFHVRGAASVPPEMARTYIAADSKHSVFYRKLSSALRASGVDVVDAPGDATAIFTILADSTGQRVVSVSARNVPREYEVWYAVEYELISGEKTLMPVTSQALTRDYTYDETLVLGKAREEEVLRDSLVDNLVRITMIQLSAL
jgi:LPS-assembly lipoprotein